MSNQKSDDQFSEEETIARREAALKRMLNMPHKPHKTAKSEKAHPSKGRGRLKKTEPPD
jgi:hypothetical protein